MGGRAAAHPPSSLPFDLRDFLENLLATLALLARLVVLLRLLDLLARWLRLDPLRAAAMAATRSSLPAQLRFLNAALGLLFDAAVDDSAADPSPSALPLPAHPAGIGTDHAAIARITSERLEHCERLAQIPGYGHVRYE